MILKSMNQAIDHFLHGKENTLVLTEADTFSCYELIFIAHNVSAKSAIHGLPECFIQHHVIPHSIASDQGNNFIAREVQQWAHAHRIHWSYYAPYQKAVRPLEDLT